MLSTGRNLHVDVPMSNVIVNRRPSGFIADQFIPQTPVSKQSDMFYRFRHGEWARYEAGLTARAPRAPVRKVHFSVSSDNYFCGNFALGTDMSAEDVANADDILKWAERHGGFLMDRLMMDYEFRIATMAVASANVSTVTQVGCAWTLGQAPIVSQMLAYQETFRQRTGMKPNTLLIPEALRRHIMVNSQLTGIMKGTGAGMASMEGLQSILGIERLLIPATQANTFGEQETMNGSWSFTDVWGSDSIILAHTDTLPGKETDTWIQAFRWTDPALGTPFALERLPYDPRHKIWEIQVGYYQSEKVVSTDLATRIIVTSA